MKEKKEKKNNNKKKINKKQQQKTIRLFSGDVLEQNLFPGYGIPDSHRGRGNRKCHPPESQMLTQPPHQMNQLNKVVPVASDNGMLFYI